MRGQLQDCGVYFWLLVTFCLRDAGQEPRVPEKRMEER